VPGELRHLQELRAHLEFSIAYAVDINDAGHPIQPVGSQGPGLFGAVFSIVARFILMIIFILMNMFFLIFLRVIVLTILLLIFIPP
jgi:hypothetical protein